MPNNNNNKKKIFILGDSMLRMLTDGQFQKIHNVYIRPFSGSKVTCMKDYAKPYIRVNYPDHKILDVEMNHLITERSAPLCSKSIVDLAKNLNIW